MTKTAFLTLLNKYPDIRKLVLALRDLINGYKHIILLPEDLIFLAQPEVQLSEFERINCIRNSAGLYYFVLALFNRLKDSAMQKRLLFGSNSVFLMTYINVKNGGHNALPEIRLVVTPSGSRDGQTIAFSFSPKESIIAETNFDQLPLIVQVHNLTKPKDNTYMLPSFKELSRNIFCEMAADVL